MQATAVRDGDAWVLNGSKCHVNMGADCDVTLFYAVAPEGLTSFLVDMHLPGIRTEVSDAIGSRLIRTADVRPDRRPGLGGRPPRPCRRRSADLPVHV